MKKFKLIIVIIALIIIGAAIYYAFGNYSNGYRAGIMIKFSNKGAIFKTYEGEMNLGMVLHDVDPSVTTTNIFKFSVSSSNDQLIKQLEDAVLAGKRVKVHYNEKFMTLPWRGDTVYMVDDVEVQN